MSSLLKKRPTKIADPSKGNVLREVTCWPVKCPYCAVSIFAKRNPLGNKFLGCPHFPYCAHARRIEQRDGKEVYVIDEKPIPLHEMKVLVRGAIARGNVGCEGCNPNYHQQEEN